jgi:methionyl aminopeptidase
VPNYGTKGTGLILKEGMVFAIEPMVNSGTHKVAEAEDGWTIRTVDGKASAHFEHTVVVRKGGAEILTQCTRK